LRQELQGRVAELSSALPAARLGMRSVEVASLQLDDMAARSTQRRRPLEAARRRSRAQKDASTGARGSTALQVGGDRFTDVGRQGQLVANGHRWRARSVAPPSSRGHVGALTQMKTFDLRTSTWAVHDSWVVLWERRACQVARGQATTVEQQ